MVRVSTIRTSSTPYQTFTSEAEVSDTLLSDLSDYNPLVPGHLGRSLLPEGSHSPGFEPVNHYEKSSVLLNRRPLMGELGGNNVYHMGTISRASKHSQNNSDKNQQVGH